MKQVRPGLADLTGGCLDPTSQGGFPLGQAVRSKQGRDNGAYYIVIGYDGTRVILADGRNRPVASPKKKNCKHLQPVGKVAADFADRYLAGGRLALTDEDLRDLLNKIKAGRIMDEGGRE